MTMMAADSPGRIGDVVDVKIGLRGRCGVVTGVTPDGLEVQIGPTAETVPLKKIGGLHHRAPAGVASVGGRIYTAMQAAAQGSVRLKWDPELLWPAVERSAHGDQATVVALDLIEAGDPEALTRFALDDDARGRLKAWQAHRNGQHREALELLLEADPRSADLPAWAIAAWMHRQGGPLVTRTELLPKNGPGLVAAVLHSLSKGEQPSVFDLQAISPYLCSIFNGSSRARLLVSAIEGVARGKTTALLDQNPTVALHRAVAGKAELAPQHACALADWPLSLIDDLIDSGCLTGTAAPYLPETAQARTKNHASVAMGDYVLARLNPAALDAETVVSLGFVDEAERRLLESDTPAFQEVLDEQRRERIGWMRSLRQNRPLAPEIEEKLSSEDDQGQLLAEVSALLRSGNVGELSLALLQDGSVVELVAKMSDSVSLEWIPEHLRDPLALRRVIDCLYKWDWDGAADLARKALRTAEREAVRDELLNLLACALWEQGKDEAAVAALEKAIEDEYSEALLANVGVVAANLDPYTAVEHFGRLADEAPNLKMRALAAERAMELWYSDPDPWAEDSETNDGPALPDKLVKTVRQLLSEQISGDHLHRFSRLLSFWDDDWLAGASPRQLGPNAGTPEIRVAQARAKGLKSLVDALAAESRKPHPPTWLAEERDRLVNDAIEAQLEMPNGMAAGFGVLVLESGMPLTPQQRIPLIAFSVGSVLQSIESSEGEPKDKFVDWILEAKDGLADVDPAMRDALESAVEMSLTHLTFAIVRARYIVYGQYSELYLKILSATAGVPRRRLNTDVISEPINAIVEFCQDSDRLLRRLVVHLPNGRAKEFAEKFLMTLRKFRIDASDVLR